MNKYKLINKTTGEEHICEKVEIDEWDYYVSDEEIKDVRPHKGKWQVEKGYILNQFPTYLTDLSECKLVIATNYPYHDILNIPKMVDEVDVLRETMVNLCLEKIKDLTKRFFWKAGFKCGYNKSQETHPFSEEDMIEFADWKDKNIQELNYSMLHNTKELLQLWKEQKTKTLYYE